LNRGGSIRIEKFNNINNFELPTNDINIIAGNDFDYKRNIIESLNIYFGSSKEDPKYIEYNGDTLKIFHKDLLISKKEYKIINLDISTINLNNELSLNKNSILRELLTIYINDIYNKTESSFLINSIINDVVEEIKNKDLFINSPENNIELDLISNDLTTKHIIDELISIILTKNNNNIPIEYLSYYEQTITMLKIIEQFIKIINDEIKVILLIDGIDYRLSNNQIAQIYNKIELFTKYSSLYIYFFTNNKNILNKGNNLLKTVIINTNNSIVYLEDLEEFVNKISQCYPVVVSHEHINNVLRKTIVNHIDYIGNFTNINDEEVPNIEEITILKILNDICDFKCTTTLQKEYLNNRYYFYLTNS